MRKKCIRRGHRSRLVGPHTVVAFILLASMVGLAACGVRYIPPVMTMSGRTKEFNAGFDQVWETAVRAFAQHNIQVKTIDKASGLIASELVVGTIGLEMDCGKIERPSATETIAGRGQGTFNVFVRKITDQRTAAQVNSKWTTVYYEYDLYGRIASATPLECTSTGVLEDRVLRFIEQISSP